MSGSVVLKYPGAKNRIARQICSYIPGHRVYLEPFFGSGAVFFNKKPSYIETINDLDDSVTNYFKVLRDKTDELVRKLALTPWGRDEYNSSYIDNDDDSDVEKARKFAVRCWQGFGAANRYRNGFRSSQVGTSPQTAKIWGELPEILSRAALRLKNAQIENLPALELIRRYDTPDVFMYIDPPYLKELRKGYLYKHEMTEQEHVELLSVLRVHRAKIMISGYDSPMYNEILTGGGWHNVSLKSQAEGGAIRVEVLWMNYETGGLFD